MDVHGPVPRNPALRNAPAHPPPQRVSIPQPGEARATPPAAIFVVDDDASVRDSLSLLFRLEGYRVETFRDGETFIAAARREQPACVLLDIHLSGCSGLDILTQIATPHFTAPIFIISGQADIPTAVKAVKRGAFDFIEKPFRGLAVVDRVNAAIRLRKERSRPITGAVTTQTLSPATSRAADGEIVPTVAHLAALTPREHQVLEQIAAGASNKEAGRTLGISPRTIEVHRARVMEKLGARNAADLVRIVLGGSGAVAPLPKPIASMTQSIRRRDSALGL